VNRRPDYRVQRGRISPYPQPVQERPDGVDDADLAAVLSDQWALAGAALEYLPVGFGGYHWLATEPAGARWFITVSDLGHEYGADLEPAMETAARLAEGGLEFVVAPVRSRSGGTVASLGPGFGVTVFGYVAGPPGHWGAGLGDADRLRVIELLARLHTAGVPAAAPVRTPRLARRDALSGALADLSSPWTAGPFGEPARAILTEREPEVIAALTRFDHLVRQVASSGSPPVLTHGEPHPGNLIHAGPGLRLIDWDSVGTAPPERDLWDLLTDSGPEAAAYTRLTGRAVDPAAVELYRLRWPLDDLCLSIAEFRALHGRDADTETSFAALTESLDDLRQKGSKVS
jgi:spectinomycin phosphotransferase